ncbi:MAG: hypothetical protein K8U57_30510 [Planctomycetes bacterium]|nr:hypothetical protein [Planctomycetota bacterium]
MSQHDMVVADATGATVRADINSGLQALASTSKGASAPSTIYTGQPWIEDDSPTSTVWTEKVYDGTDSIPKALIDTVNNRYLSAIPLAPGGRLTLTTSTPVMNADSSGATTVYYTPYVSDLIPLYSTFFAPYVFTELSLALDSNSGHTGYHQTGKNFDLFVTSDSGTLRLVTGPAWSSDTARGSGAGTTELERKNGLWTNKNSMTARFGSVSGNTITVAANQGTYVGTMRATADGQTSMVFKPAATAGGNANVLGLYNAHNRVTTRAMSRDSTASWNYATATWRVANAAGTGSGLNNRISFIDGLQTSSIEAKYNADISNTNSQAGIVGINLDSTSGTPGITAQNAAALAGNAVSIESFSPQLGFHYVQAMEYSTGATSTFFGTNSSQQQMAVLLTLEM